MITPKPPDERPLADRPLIERIDVFLSLEDAEDWDCQAQALLREAREALESLGEIADALFESMDTDDIDAEKAREAYVLWRYPDDAPATQETEPGGADPCGSCGSEVGGPSCAYCPPLDDHMQAADAAGPAPAAGGEAP